MSEELGAVLKLVLPRHVNRHRCGGGTPRIPARQCADAIFYVLRTGCQWQALDATELCRHSTAPDRCQEGVAAGVFQKLWRAGGARVAEVKGLDGSWLSMEGAMSKAPLGGKKNRAESHGSGQKRGQTERADRGPRRAARLDGGGRQSA